MSVVETAVTWAIGIANDSSHGYSQANRNGPDYDCSALVCWAYYNAGLNTRPGYTPTTHTMYGIFTACGFIDVTASCNISNGAGMERGDVLLNVQNHTAMYIGNGQMVQASSDRGHPETGDQTGTEIWVCPYSNYSRGGWDYILRYPDIKSVSLVRWIPG